MNIIETTPLNREFIIRRYVREIGKKMGAPADLIYSAEHYALDCNQNDNDNESRSVLRAKAWLQLMIEDKRIAN